MRYENWDVLLFPGTDLDSAHVPCREFRTECFAVRETYRNKSVIAPLMTSYIPSIEEHAPFQISVHSWAPQHFCYTADPDADQPHQKEQVWSIHVTVDGSLVAHETIPEPVIWPQILTLSRVRAPSSDSDQMPLQFPKFHDRVMSELTWNANDPTGRIKIEIAEGYLEKTYSDDMHFVKLMTHVVFNFQPAPLPILQNTGIAWPNPNMFKNALSVTKSTSNTACATPKQAHHHRNMSASSTLLSPANGMPVPPPTPTIDTSRSTSAYSTIPSSVLPLSTPLRSAGHINAQEMKFRLPSDQFQKLLDALNKPQLPSIGQAVAQASVATGGMQPPPPPPPPLPLNGGERMYRREINHSDNSGVNEDDFSFYTPAIRSRKEGPAIKGIQDTHSTPLVDTQAAHGCPSSPLSCSPTNGNSIDKRARSTLKSIRVNDGSPKKLDKVDESGRFRKSVRRVSRASGSNREIICDRDEEMALED